MMHKTRQQLAQSIATSGSTYKTGGLTFPAIPSPLLMILATGQLEGLNLGGTVTGPDGQPHIVLDAKWYGDVCALTLVPQAILAQ